MTVHRLTLAEAPADVLDRLDRLDAEVTAYALADVMDRPVIDVKRALALLMALELVEHDGTAFRTTPRGRDAIAAAREAAPD